MMRPLLLLIAAVAGGMWIGYDLRGIVDIQRRAVPTSVIERPVPVHWSDQGYILFAGGR